MRKALALLACSMFVLGGCSDNSSIREAEAASFTNAEVGAIENKIVKDPSTGRLKQVTNYGDGVVLTENIPTLEEAENRIREVIQRTNDWQFPPGPGIKNPPTMTRGIKEMIMESGYQAFQLYPEKPLTVIYARTIVENDQVRPAAFFVDIIDVGGKGMINIEGVSCSLLQDKLINPSDPFEQTLHRACGKGS